MTYSHIRALVNMSKRIRSLKNPSRPLPDHRQRRSAHISRALLQAYLSTTPVREAMIDLQQRVHALLTQMIQLGQDRGEIRSDLPAADFAHVFRQTIFGTLLIWSLYGDASLHSRIEAAFNVLWTGLAPRQTAPLPSQVPFFTSGH